MKALLHVTALLMAVVGILPFVFDQHKYAAWQTDAREKLSQLSESVAQHAGAFWTACTTALAALGLLISHHLPVLRALVSPTSSYVKQNPHDATLGLLVVLVVIIGIPLLYLGALFLVFIVCRIMANHSKGPIGACAAFLAIFTEVVNLYVDAK
jgi:hypothetical protein